MTTTRLKVKGMRCAGCVSAVEKALTNSPGVENASVNLATEDATIEHDPQKASVDQLVDTVKEAGYDAESEDEDEDEPDSTDAGAASMRVGKQAWLWRVMVGAVLAVPVMILSMTWQTPTSSWIQFALATPVQVLLGWAFYIGAYKATRHLRANMDTLVAVGSTTAYVYSVYLTFAGASMVYFETAVMILVLIGVGKWLESRARSSAAAAIHDLMNLQPPQATVLRDGQEQTIDVDDVRAGDHVLVRPGERIAVDGKVIKGSSAIDQSMVTGESVPVEVGRGDNVIGGTINQSGSLTFEAERTGDDMFLSQVVDLVRQAQSTKANVQRVADAVAGWFVQAVIVVAVLSLLSWGLVAGDWGHAIFVAIAVLIVACPCAMGLATPAAIMVGTGMGAKRGILIKDAAAFERAGRLTHVILDKTGTLTRGSPAVRQIRSLDDDLDDMALLRLAASIERQSEHPLGRAIVEHAKRNDIELGEADDFDSITGGGVKGKVDGKSIVIGKRATLEQEGVDSLDGLDEPMRELSADGATTVGVAIDGRAVGVIALADPIKDDAKQVVSQLHDMGLQVILLTGDQQAAADAVAGQLGIDEVMAEVMPQDKQSKVQELREAGHVVAMVGDGINDAPALAAADFGVAMGAAGHATGGSDIAMEAGHVVLNSGDLGGLTDAIHLSRATLRRIHLGLFWAFAYNTVLIPLAVAGVLHPMLAAAAMSFSSVSVVLNALYLKRTGQRR